MEEIAGRGVCIGAVVASKSKELVIHSVTRDFAANIARLITLLNKVEAVSVDFCFSTIQVLIIAAVKPHIDKNAMG